MLLSACMNDNRSGTSILPAVLMLEDIPKELILASSLFRISLGPNWPQKIARIFLTEVLLVLYKHDQQRFCCLGNYFCYWGLAGAKILNKP